MPVALGQRENQNGEGSETPEGKIKIGNTGEIHEMYNTVLRLKQWQTNDVKKSDESKSCN